MGRLAKRLEDAASGLTRGDQQGEVVAPPRLLKLGRERRSSAPARSSAVAPASPREQLAHALLAEQALRITALRAGPGSPLHGAESYPLAVSARTIGRACAGTGGVVELPRDAPAPADHRRPARPSRDRRGRAAAERQLPRVDHDRPPGVPRQRRHDRGDDAARHLQPQQATACRSAAAIPSRRPAATAPATARRSGGTSSRPARAGSQIRANGGFDVVVAVYTWSRALAHHPHGLCQNDERGSEDVADPDVSAREPTTRSRSAAASNTGGPLSLLLDYFPDTRRRRRSSTTPDKCRMQPGIERFGGCPPELRSAPRIRYDGVGGGMRITGLAIDDVPKGARAEVRCGRCGRKVSRRATRTGTLKVGGFVGRTVRHRRPHRDPRHARPHRQGPLPLRRRRQVLPLADHGRAGSASARRAASSRGRASPRSADETRGSAWRCSLAAALAAPAGRRGARADGARLRGPARRRTSASSSTGARSSAQRRVVTDGDTLRRASRARAATRPALRSTGCVPRSSSRFPRTQAIVEAFVRCVAGGSRHDARRSPSPASTRRRSVVAGTAVRGRDRRGSRSRSHRRTAPRRSRDVGSLRRPVRTRRRRRRVLADACSPTSTSPAGRRDGRVGRRDASRSPATRAG